MPRTEIMPGVFVGSEAGDLDRALKVAITEMLDGDETAAGRVEAIADRRSRLLVSLPRVAACAL